MLAALILAATVLTENVPTRTDPSQTYTLILPGSYDPAKKHPLLLVLDPRGRANVAAKIFEEAADEHGWIIVSSNGTRSDAGPEPNERALRALLPEVVQRYPVDIKRVYATGFSGTAITAWSLGVRSNGLAGVIGVGGRLVDEVPPAKFNFAHYGFSGEDDFNNRDMRAVDALLTVPHRFESFPGDHRWITPALARDAIRWMEVMAMKENRRARDDAFIDKAYAADVAAAAALTPRESLRRYQAIVRTFEGLRPIDDASAAAVRLEKDPVVRRELEAEKKWDEFEERYIRSTLLNLRPIFAPIQSANPAEAKRHLLREFRVEEMKKRATREGAEGRTARRILGTIYGQLSSYLPRELEGRGAKDLAEGARAAAAEMKRVSASAASSSIDGVVSALRASGLEVRDAGTVDQPFFGVPARVFTVDGNDLQLYEFPNAADAGKAAGQVSPNGGSIGAAMISWMAAPHFFRKDRLIANYLGSSERTLAELERVFGPQFAGQ